MIAGFLASFGKYLLMLRRGIARPEKSSMYLKEIIRQVYDIGIGSLIIVFLISMFIGAVTAVQFSYQLGTTFVPMYYIGYVVRDITIIELAPTITCLVLAGKVGSNMAAELGGMRQKEHIDAMEIMGVNRASFLMRPKIIARLIIISLLLLLSPCVGILGGYLASVPTDILSHTDYVRGLRSFFVPYNITLMLVKAFVFAFILTSVSSFQGYYVKGGSIELGKASTNAVVFSDILILIADYLIAVLLT